MEITITEKNIKKYPIQNTDSGMLIDELAYSAGFCSSDEIYNYIEEPSEPYNFDYETDLLGNTKTLEKLTDIVNTLEIDVPENTLVSGGSNLQAGAYIALNTPGFWNYLLEAYTDTLKENGVNSISKNFNKELQIEIDENYDYHYNEWLHGDRSNEGVVVLISRHFTETREGYYNKKDNEYTFILSEYDVEQAKNNGYNKRQLKKYLLDTIKNKGEERQYKDKQEREKKKAERERLAQYKKEQAEKEYQAHREKLLAMTM